MAANEEALGNVLASAMAAPFQTALMNPLDCLRVRFQVSHQPFV